MKSTYTLFNLTNSELSVLRGDIILNSPNLAHYQNRYSIRPSIVKSYFDGYYRYLFEKARSIPGVNRSNFRAVAYAQDEYDTLIEWRSIWEARRVQEARALL